MPCVHLPGPSSSDSVTQTLTKLPEIANSMALEPLKIRPLPCRARHVQSPTHMLSITDTSPPAKSRAKEPLKKRPGWFHTTLYRDRTVWPPDKEGWLIASPLRRELICSWKECLMMVLHKGAICIHPRQGDLIQQSENNNGCTSVDALSWQTALISCRGHVWLEGRGESSHFSLLMRSELVEFADVTEDFNLTPHSVGV